MHIVIVDSDPADQGNEQVWSPLKDLGDLAIYPRTAASEVIDRCRAAQAILTNKVVLNADTLAQLPELKYIGVTATGTNIVDIAAAKSRGIAVTNVPAYSTASVAQLVFAYILHFANAVTQHDEAVKAGSWSGCQDFSFLVAPIHELAGKILVTVGTGAIGGAVASISAAFGMKHIAAAAPGSTTPGRMPLEEALPVADYVSLHCPLTPQTQHLVNEAFLKQMKPSAYLINTGRGPLVDEAALASAIAEGQIAGAAVDVLSTEPPAADNPLLATGTPWSKRLVVTPHIGWATVEARERLVTETIENVKAFARGENRNRVG